MRKFYLDIIEIVRAYPVGTKFTSDMVRKDALLKNAARPQHENGWGFALLMVGRSGVAKKTGRYFPSDIPSSNNRMIAEWERISS